MATIIGTTGDDFIAGTSGNDSINAGNGNDTINGGAGNDTINAGDGNDIVYYNITQNAGYKDSYTGGDGNDTLVLIVTKAQYDAIMSSTILHDFAVVEGKGQKFDFSNYNLGFSFNLTAQTFEHLVLDQRPQATDDFYGPSGINEDQSVLLTSILTNDDALTNAVGKKIISVQTTTTPNGDGSFDVVSALGALVHVNADGTFTYNPTSAPKLQALTAGEIGHDSFVYSIKETDPLSTFTNITSATVHVDVTGVNDAPVAAATTQSTNENTFKAFDIAFTDVDHLDTHTVSISQTLSPGQVSHGTLTAMISADTTNIVGPLALPSGTIHFSYDPTANANAQALSAGETATDFFKYTLNDGHGGLIQKAVTISLVGVNDAPVAANISQSIGADTS